MATSNKSKKILEKARKVAAKTKKKKVSKAEKTDVKKKTTFYPEGQNAPQSKKYTQESDKTLSAKATGWRWTKEGAKKVGKPVESKPTTSDIEKYRNETFKLKGKPNKSGPKGVGDGSHRYLYVERRADKADITRKNKLEDGGEMAKGGEVKKGDVVKIQGKDFKVVNKFDSMGTKKYFLVPTDDTKDKYGFLSAMTLTEKELASNTQMAKGGEVGGYFEYVNWNEVQNMYDEDDDNKGYIYGINLIDEDSGEVIDVEWFNTEEKRENAIKKYNLVEYDYPNEDGEMARGGKIPSSEVAEFKNYVKDYYGEGGIFSEFFPPVGVSSKEVNLAVNQYIDYCKTKDDQWGGGDTFDREIVRDIMLYNRGTKKGLEYQRAIKEIFGKDKKEYGGILQPMIGGVNADPRFDIYNTTMFAEKGAELEKGGKIYDSEDFEDWIYENHPTFDIDNEEFQMFIDEHYQNMLPHAKNFKNLKEWLDGQYAKGGTTFGKFGSGRLNKNAWISANYIGDSKVKLGDLQSYLQRNTNEDFDKNKIYTITRTLFKSGDYEIDDNKDWKLSTIYRKRKMAKGGSTHEQGYDDREDESLAMRHGKIARKHFVGSHARREHSRRDDAHFETRHKRQ